MTDSDGIAEITTIYPGYYQGRTPHIHAKVHLNNATILTTQFFFDDARSDSVYGSGDPYLPAEGRQVNNTNDCIFDDTLILTSPKRTTATSGPSRRMWRGLSSRAPAAAPSGRPDT